MKPIKLVIDGLNSFETRQELDFSALGEGVFGIFGKTGSGKSTILDAITLALYGEVERSKQNVDFINTKTKKAVVEFLFEIYHKGKNKTYFVRRSFSVKKNGKDVDSNAELFEVDESDEKKSICEGVNKVDDKMFSILGLGVREFSKCIALPQGEFSAFLKAKPAERTDIMSNIFDLSCYGEKLASSVKEKVFEFDKQVSALTQGLEIVSYATDDLLNQAKSDFETSSSSYNELTAELKQKSKELSDKELVKENQSKLKAIKSELAELEEKQQEMKDLESEIERHQNANNIKADYEKLKKLKVDERELSEKMSGLNETKLKVQAEATAAENEFNDYKEIFNTKTVELNSKLARFDDLKKLDEEQRELEQEKTKIEVQIQEKKRELASFGEKLEFIQLNQSNIEEKIQKIDDFIASNKPDVDLSYALEQTKGIESELLLIEDFYKNVEKLVDQTDTDLKTVQEEYNSAISEEKQLQAQREKIQNSIEVAFEDADTTNFKKLRSCDKELEGMHEVEVSVQKVNEVIAKIDLDTENRMATIASLDEDIAKKQEELASFEENIMHQEQKVEDTRVEREEMLGESVVNMLSDHLKIGDICPVCESRVIQKVYGEKVDLSSIEGELQKEITSLKSMRFERDKIFVELISLKARYEFEKAEIEINKKEIQKLKDSKNSLYQKFVDNNDESEENFNKLMELLTKTADSLEDLINLQETLRDAELRVTINKAQAGTKVTIYKNYLESLIDILYDLQKKKAEREFAIYNVNEEFKNLKEYKKQIAEGKNIEIIIDSKKEERIKLRDEQVKIANEHSDVQKQMAEVSSSLDVLAEKLENNEKNLSATRAKIMTSGVPEGVSLAEEKQATQRAIEELKFNFDDKESKLYSCRENLNRTVQEYEVTSSILNSKHEEIENLEASVSANMINFEFKSNEDLENYFIDSSILKIKQNKLADYNGRVKVLEIQRQELEEKELGEVAEGEVEELKKQVENLDIKVKELSQNVGKTGADLERISEANAKNHELSEKLKIAKNNYDIAKDLSNILKGRALAEYVAEEYLESITGFANSKLSLLMDGKYTLKFVNKEFVVEDNFSDGLIRPASTLSGGETFLVSLSLALSISETISMMSSRSMDFFFLDEGFGTLDGELCEAVVDALYKLESQNLKIGLITHVKELEESIKNKVYVSKDSKGSHIKISHSL